MSPVSTQRVEALLRDGGQRLPDELPYPADLAGGGPLPDDTGNRLGLSCLSELLQEGEVDPLSAKFDGAEAPAAGCLSFASFQVNRGCVDGALPRRKHLSFREQGAGRELSGYLAGAGCCIGRCV